MAITTLLCYAPEDERMKRKLRDHLISLERNGLIEVWDYDNVNPGVEWKQELNEHLGKAQVILLLITRSFLASNYCYTVLMQEAIKRHERKDAQVIPVLLRPVYWEEAPLDKLRALPDDNKPIPRWKPQDEGFRNVVLGIKKVIDQWNANGLPDPKVERKEMIANLDRLIETVKSQMQPPGRGVATAATLQELSIFIPTDVTLADLVIGWRTLSHLLKQGEEIAIERRRITCGELANMASQFAAGQGDLAQAINTWKAWAEAFKKSDDSRQVTMANTFARELKELQEAAR